MGPSDTICCVAVAVAIIATAAADSPTQCSLLAACPPILTAAWPSKGLPKARLAAHHAPPLRGGRVGANRRTMTVVGFLATPVLSGALAAGVTNDSELLAGDVTPPATPTTVTSYLQCGGIDARVR